MNATTQRTNASAAAQHAPGVGDGERIDVVGVGVGVAGTGSLHRCAHPPPSGQRQMQAS